MLKIWTVLLLCGVLPFQQAVAQEGSLVTAVIDLRDLEESLSPILNDVLGRLLGELNPRESRGSSTGGTSNEGKGLLRGLFGRRRRDLLEGVLGGKDGLLEGVLGGKDGLLGGVLGGKDGLLGGVLGGKDGLLGGVLGGKDGLLGSVLGGQGGLIRNILNLLNLKIVNGTLVDIKLEILPGARLQLKISVKLEILQNKNPGAAPGKARPSMTDLHILVGVDIKASLQLVQDKSGALKLVVENCMTDLAHIELLPGTVLHPVGGLLSNILNSLLPNLLCQILPNVLNTLLDTLNNILSVGTLGSLQYTLAELLMIQEKLLLNLNINLSDNNGNTINHVPAELAALPPVTDHASKLLLSPNILLPLLELLVKGGQFNADITPQMLSGTVPMTTSELESILPQVSGLLPPNAPLEVKIRISDAPIVSLQNGNLMVTLKATIEVLAQTHSGLTPLLALEADIKLVGKLIISGTYLRLSLALESIDLRLVSSEIGDIDVELLKNLLLDIIRVGYMPHVNAALGSAAMPLPKILNLGYPDGQANILENTIVAPLAPKLP